MGTAFGLGGFLPNAGLGSQIIQRMFLGGVFFDSNALHDVTYLAKLMIAHAKHLFSFIQSFSTLLACFSILQATQSPTIIATTSYCFEVKPLAHLLTHPSPSYIPTTSIRMNFTRQADIPAPVSNPLPRERSNFGSQSSRHP